MTLRRKLAFASALAVLLTSLVATAVVYFTVSKMQVSQIDRQLVLRLQASDPRTLERELRRSAEATSFTIGDNPAYLFDAIVNGRRIPGTGVTSIVSTTKPQRSDAITVSTVDVDSTLVHHVRIAQVQLPSGALVRVMRSIDDINTVVRDIGLAVALIGTGFAIISAVAIALLVAHGLRPLQALAAKASEAGKSGDFRPLLVEAERSGSDEVAELSHSLGFMAGNVIDSRERQRRLVDDAAHELRTPLTSLRTNLQLLQQSHQQGRPLSDEVMRSALEFPGLAEVFVLGLRRRLLEGLEQYLVARIAAGQVRHLADPAASAVVLTQTIAWANLQRPLDPGLSAFPEQ
ncbi:MAG: HAMP domain-containing protein, partial [Actinobacteria bacterium]|nr:HAMP domain-containing protein [Actinomycetota bacterium]